MSTCTRRMGRLAAFLSGWVSFVIGFAGPSAASASGFGRVSAQAPFPRLEYR